MAVDLETALHWTLTSNPNLTALRPNVDASAAAVAVARQFPMEWNPSLSVDVWPWTFERDIGQGAARLNTVVSVKWTQPIGPGRRGHRLGMAQASYDQVLLQVRQWLIYAENAKLDMLWQATQAYADLLAATGATPLLGAQPIPANPPEAEAERPPE